MIIQGARYLKFVTNGEDNKYVFTSFGCDFTTTRAFFMA